MKLKFFFFSILCVLACSAPRSTPGANGAKFIFRATVEQITAATLSEISDVSNCVVVKVTEVVSAPPGFTDWTGKSITVAVKEINIHKPESELLFYTNGWLYGKSLAVVEISSVDSGAFTNQEVLKGIANEQDNEIQERLKRSELVVSGEVLRISDPEKHRLDSEHDPYWVKATVEIDKEYKGNAPDSTITFRFPSSYDIMWQNSPKFKQGDKGIWLLRRSEGQDNTFMITEAEDFYSIEQSNYIENLLKQ